MKRFEDIGGTVRAARLENGRSQRHLAAAARTSQAYLDKLEHNQIDPRYSTLARVLKELGYELVAIPTARVGLLQDVLHGDPERPLIDPWEPE
jgi:predicted transcriptional regulator